MKIGLLLPSLFASKTLYPEKIFAPGNLLSDLSNGLVNKNHEVFVFSTPDFSTSAQLISSPIESAQKNLPYYKFRNLEEPRKSIQTTEVIRRIFEIDSIAMAFTYARDHNLEIIHCYHDSIFFSVHYLAQLFSVPVLYSLHDPIAPKGTIEYQELLKFKNDNYIALSSQMRKNELQLNFVATIPHGIKQDRFIFSENPKNNLVFSGRYLPEKGVTEAIEIALKLGRPLSLASTPNYHQGEYYKNQMKQLIEENANLITELSFLSNEKMNEFYGNGKIFIFPLKWEEPFGLVMIEAMACGTPIVAYARGSVPEIVKDGVTGFIVNSSQEDKRGDWIVKKTGTDGLCKAVEKIYAMPTNQYQEMRKNSRKRFEDNFTVEEMVNNYEQVYREILDKQ